MSTVPTAFTQVLPQELRDFVREPRVYVLASAWPEQLDVKFANTLMTLPADGQFDRNGHSGVFPDGSPIPGSFALVDSFAFKETTGEETFAFDAKAALGHILGIQRGSDNRMVCLSTYAQKGVFYVPKGTTPAQFALLLGAARERARAAEVRYAYELVAAHDAANAKRKLAGDNPLSGGPEIDKARRVIEAAQEKRSAKEGPVRAEEMLGATTTEDDVESTAYLHAYALQLAEKVAAQTRVDKTKLFEMLIRDPEVKAYARKRKIKLRVNAHLDVPGEEQTADPDVVQRAMAEVEREEQEIEANAPDAPALDEEQAAPAEEQPAEEQPE